MKPASVVLGIAAAFVFIAGAVDSQHTHQSVFTTQTLIAAVLLATGLVVWCLEDIREAVLDVRDGKRSGVEQDA